LIAGQFGGQKLEEVMKVSSIIERKTGDVITISPQANLKAAANLMRNHRIAALVVMKSGKAVGLVSERDIVEALSRHGGAAELVRVQDILPSRFVVVSPEETIKHAMAIMTYERVRHLPVIDEGQLVGIVSLGDIVKYRLEELELETNVLRDVYVAAR
jgi:CBS domain-containing protein